MLKVSDATNSLVFQHSNFHHQLSSLMDSTEYLGKKHWKYYYILSTTDKKEKKR